MNFQDYNTLSTVINDTFGQTYEAAPGFMKCSVQIVGEDRMQMTSMSVVNLLTRSNMQVAAKDSEAELQKLTNECLKRIKKDFKATAGRALKTKKVSSDTSVELINMNIYSDKGTALVRQVHMFEIS
jgi:hypothetical protein